MPRILLSAAHITPLILTSLSIEHSPPALVGPYPPLPNAFHVTRERVEILQKVDAVEKYEARVKAELESAKKPFCQDVRNRPRVS